MTVAMPRVAPEPRRAGRLIVTAVGIAQIMSMLLGVGRPLQPLLSVIFVMTVPGFRLLDLERPREISARLIVAIGASLSVNTALAAIALVTDAGIMIFALAVGLWVAAVLPDHQLQATVAGIGSFLRNLRRPSRGVPDSDRVLRFRFEPTPPNATGGGEPEVAAEESFATVLATTPPHEAGVPVSATATELTELDLNTADAVALEAVPGIGPRTTGRILEFRIEHGPFEALDDLLQIPGIGPSRLQALAGVVKINDPPPSSPPQQPPASPPSTPS